MTQDTENKEGNDKDANENNVEKERQMTDVRFSHPNVVLPPEPTGRCSNSVQKRIVDSLENKKRNGIDFNAKIQKMKDFRNPSIYEKLVSFLNIQENGTNYPPELYDPEAWMKEPNYEILAKQQKEVYEKKEKEKAKRTQIQFLSGTKKSATEITATAVEEAKKRKSKWDISATSAPVVTAPVLAKAISDATSSAAKKAKS
ncbi:SAP30-binding protein-like [Actinia tenebrosa]|uniref:SAP30-binding protein-like n=1 Tax=Actinia tenebrosa TaxID=6105 RepID=A0A6P8H081_ACTTE|nr:SAP30-binding protein-like [Actinia tenebrosa]